MINKILLSIVIFLTVYILLIFKSPELAGLIEKTLGIEGFNEFVLGSKGSYDDAITKLPSAGELTESYSNAYSGAIELKDTVIEGADYTKDKIDGFRDVMSGAEDTYNDIKNGINEVKEFVDSASGAIKETQELIENVTDIKETITNTGITN